MDLILINYEKIILIVASLVLNLPTFASWNGTSAPWTHGMSTYYNPYRIESDERLAHLVDMINVEVSDY